MPTRTPSLSTTGSRLIACSDIWRAAAASAASGPTVMARLDIRVHRCFRSRGFAEVTALVRAAAEGAVAPSVQHSYGPMRRADGPSVPDDHRRAVRVRGDREAGRAEQQAGEAAVPARAGDDDVGGLAQFHEG